MRIAVILLLVQIIGSTEWPFFGGDQGHTGYKPQVDFTSGELRLRWRFDLGEHIWRYRRGVSVWSSSPVAAEVDGRMLVFVGAYDQNLYCLDALSGEKVWEFTTGGALSSAPAFDWVNGEPTVFVVSSDRTVYALDARNGRKKWCYETLPWSYTICEAVPSSPVVGEIEGRRVVIFGIWNSDKRPIKGFQRGELFVLDAATGEKVWSEVISTTYLSSPAYALIDGSPFIFISSSAGEVRCLEGETGRTVWRFTAGAEVRSSPTVGEVSGRWEVFIGTRFGMLYALDARSGEVIWSYKAGHAIDSTPALGEVKGRPVLFFGSYDRAVYAVDALTGRKLWRFITGKYITASPAVGRIGGRTAVFICSLDDRIYAIDGETGELIWSYRGGGRVWPYETRGESLWSSPIIISSGGEPLLLFPSYDGRLYAFCPR
ncbi:hypothetical protein DRP77_00695 [Candidatus Poribacteria bacterium]|nr:MAG: hypothetical protein DRP77_00695 [Candidatus Poribacteria bacterium]